MNNKINVPKITFFFGAGAEQIFDLPSGAEYTERTMLRKRKNMYEALRDFYKNRTTNYIKDGYQAEFLFTQASHTFWEIINMAANEALQMTDCDHKTKNYIRLMSQYNKYKEMKPQDDITVAHMKKYKDDLDIVRKEIYSAVVEGKESEYNSIKKCLAYYGAVEKDFATILAPNRAGEFRFWRLINYFWSAFFAIFLPLCDNVQPSWYPLGDRDTKEKYKSVLKNFPTSIIEVWKHYNYAEIDNKEGNYYSVICKEYPESSVLTTNYTPFVAHYFDKRNVYLSGRVSEFEYPTKNLVKDIVREGIEEDEDICFVFPFLMTQAPIKPIITPKQIEEYYTAIQILAKTDVLVIIGYSLGEADNHINAILRDYMIKGTKRLIYCDYVASGTIDSDDRRNKVLSSLKLPEHMRKQIEIVQHNGTATQLLRGIKDKT